MFVLPSLDNLPAGISIISHVDIFKISCNCNTSAIEDPLEIIQLYENNIDQILNQN